MSFPALFLACQAVDHLPPLEDDEFGLSWKDLDRGPELDITWAMYESITGAVVFGVRSVRPQTIGEYLEAP